MIDTICSKHGISIRLTDERWAHIVEEHNELAGLRLDILETVAEPETVVAGNYGEQLAIKEYEPEKWLVVVYRELQAYGFIITAFLTRRRESLTRRRQLWP